MTVSDPPIDLVKSPVPSYSSDGEQERVMSTLSQSQASVQSGRGNSTIAQMNQQTSDERFRSTLQHQIHQGRFTFVLQPIVSVSSGETVMREALLRYRAKDGVIWPASSLVPRAEDIGAIDLIDCEALRVAASYLADRPTERLSINLSRRSLNSRTWQDKLDRYLRKRPELAQQLVIEVTETANVDAAGDLLNFIERMKVLGIAVAIDDFGAGVTTWADLEPSSVSLIKFDRSLVIDHDQGALMIRAILDLTRERGIETVAEGIETRALADHVIGLGVDHLQGYLFGAPQVIS